MQQEVEFDLVTWSASLFPGFDVTGLALLGAAFLVTLTPGAQSFLKRVLSRHSSRLAVASIVVAAGVSFWLELSVAVTAAVAVWAAAPACALSLLERWEAANAERPAQLECGLALWIWLPLCLSVPGYMGTEPERFLTAGFSLALYLSVLVFLGARPRKERKWRVPARVEPWFLKVLAAFAVASLAGIATARIAPSSIGPSILIGVFACLILLAAAAIAAVEFVLGSVAQVSVEGVIGPSVGAGVVVGAFTGALASSVASSASTFWLLLVVFTPLGFIHSLIFRRQASAGHDGSACVVSRERE